MTIVLLITKAPPTVFRLAFAALVKSKVKFTLVGAVVPLVEQLSMTPMGIMERPQRENADLRKSFLSIKRYAP